MIYLQSLHITNSYKLLQDFRLDFQALPVEGYEVGMEWLTVLLGNNGSGKSSVLEAITYIFKGTQEHFLHGRLPEIPFDFQLRYLTSTTTEEWGTLPREIHSAFPLPLPESFPETHTRYVDVLLSGKQIVDAYTLRIEIATGRSKSGEVIWEPIKNAELLHEFLPSLVIYYAGVSESILNIYRAFEKVVLNESRVSAVDTSLMEATALPLYYLRAEDIGLLLTALYSFEFNSELDGFMESSMKMRKPEENTVIITIQPPSYGNKKGRSYENGWKSEGVLGVFLEQLRDKVTFMLPTADQDAYTLHFNLNDWYRLREAYSSERELLALLLLLKANNMVIAARVNFIRNGVLLHDEDLSEGEQQLLVVRALAELLVSNDGNTLLLFDEPDTFLHPQWQENFFTILEPLAERAFCLVTTHSPILLAQMRTGRINELAHGCVQFSGPAPYGQRYADTLTNFMIERPRPEEVYEEFNELFRLIDQREWAKARDMLKLLQNRPGPEDAEVMRAERMMNFLAPTVNEIHRKKRS